MRAWPLVFVLLALAAGGHAIPPANAAKALHDLFAAAWDQQMQEDPEHASELGDRRWNDRWMDRSPEGYARRDAANKEVLAKLAKIDRKSLSKTDQLNYDLFQKRYLDRVEQYKVRWFLMTFNQREGPQTSDDLGNSLRFETVKDYEDWLARLRAVPTAMEQFTALLREGIKERMVHPRVIMERIPAQIDKQIVSDPTQSGFYKPFKTFPPTISATDQQRLQQDARQAVEQQVVPAFTKFKQFFVGEYLPACYGQVGAWQLPHGKELYAQMIRHYTTTNMTPEEVHETGLKEVARINGEMDRVMQQTGFKGSRDEFFKFLRTDPQFFYKTPEELVEAYKALAKTVDPNLVKVFRTLPREPYGVEAIPMAFAPDTTAAYYRPGAADGSRAGTYFVNLYKPDARPKWEMTALSLHESVPGHHLQIARAHELGEMPKFRRFGEYTAYVEGWGLYAESLGEDMGLYGDPYSKFGQLSYEMWRAVRLVVDTGIHVKHWTREQAIKYFMENCPKHELDITNEVDRYIAWPGQALAYKLGELKIKELRGRAKEKLSAKFDLKEFHDVVLGSGPLPLDILEQNVDEWIAKQTVGTGATAVNGNAAKK
ncbi:MAG TPA: DUF885 domain-containing protein [Candidatus Angelobacter sp.]|jgi:uncharacterized protein (DUF885 family)|nr:DUF885 domain-containing protein [Candidatus Angelobacter sp.]